MNDNNFLKDYEKDHIISDYIKCRSNVFIMTLWPKSIKLFKKLVNYLKKEGNIYYTKIKLNYNGFFNILYQLYSDIEKKMITPN